MSWDSKIFFVTIIWTASSEFGTYHLCEQRRFRRACASAQSRQNLRFSLIQAVTQEEPSDRKPDPWALWMAGHAQLKLVMTECSKTQIRLTGLIFYHYFNTGLNKNIPITFALRFSLSEIKMQYFILTFYTPTNHSHAKPLSLPILVNYFLWNVFL